MSTQTRRFIADTLAMVILSTIVGMIVEVCISRYTLVESVHIRLSAMIPNLLTGRLNGVFTDYVRRRWYRVQSRQHVRSALADVTAFMLFQVPLYITVQTIGTWPDVQPSRIISSCATVTIISLFIGKPYGWLLDQLRQALRVPSSAD